MTTIQLGLHPSTVSACWISNTTVRNSNRYFSHPFLLVRGFLVGRTDWGKMVGITSHIVLYKGWTYTFSPTKKDDAHLDAQKPEFRW